MNLRLLFYSGRAVNLHGVMCNVHMCWLTARLADADRLVQLAEMEANHAALLQVSFTSVKVFFVIEKLYCNLNTLKFKLKPVSRASTYYGIETAVAQKDVSQH